MDETERALADVAGRVNRSATVGGKPAQPYFAVAFAFSASSVHGGVTPVTQASAIDRTSGTGRHASLSAGMAPARRTNLSSWIMTSASTSERKPVTPGVPSL